MVKRRLARGATWATAAGGLCLGAALPVTAQTTVVVPQALTTVEGITGTDITFAPFTFSILQYIPAGANGNVAGLNPGDVISGLRFRLDNQANTNGIAIGSADYDIYLSQGVTTVPTGTSVAARTYSNYYVGATREQVRNGRLSIAANSYSSSASGAVPEEFGPTIGFGTYDPGGALTATDQYVYRGGALVFELRYTQFNDPGSSDRIFVDLERDSAIVDGYTFLFNSANGAANSATVAEYRIDDFGLVTGFVTTAAIPEPASLPLLFWVTPTVLLARRLRSKRRG